MFSKDKPFTRSRGLLLLLVSGNALFACEKTPTATATAKTAEPTAKAAEVAAVPEEDGSHARYTHEHVLAMLREDDAVIPKQPPVYAVHTVYNREAIVPPMCYTRTEGTHNPCYVCHQDKVPGRPNVMDDGDLQVAYSFSAVAATNQWRNLFEDRSERVAAISDEEILAWIAQDNYSELAPRLREAGFEGYIPDLEDLHLAAEAFDDEGFAKDGSGWVAFSYKPMPSTFWPTNGSTDDAMIRLPEAFRTTAQGESSRDVYKANLAIVEATIKGLQTVTVSGVDEEAVGVDLDGDGTLGTIHRITNVERYVGAASNVLRQPFLYPQDTEFLHSVRYVGVDAQGNIFNPPRMKELRYMRKRWAVSKDQLHEAYMQEQDAKDVGQLPGYVDRGDYGFDNEMGWVLAGFIENRNGRLRGDNYEETLFCMGCHTSVGSTIDSTFSFARKVDGAAGWGYIDLRGMPDAPNMGETRGEIATYLQRAGGGGEFRSNPEMEARWFRDGRVDPDELAKAEDVYDLITPSRERALLLNKAYRVIVDDQDFIHGRDATVTPPRNVYDVVDNDDAPTLPPDKAYRWDIRLDWSRTSTHLGK